MKVALRRLILFRRPSLEEPKPTARGHFRLPPSAFRLPPSAFRLPPSAFRLPPSAFRLLPSAFRLPPSAFRLLPSAFCLPPSALPGKPTGWSHIQIEIDLFEFRILFIAVSPQLAADPALLVATPRRFVISRMVSINPGNPGP
jgi:hypothetical protein